MKTKLIVLSGILTLAASLHATTSFDFTASGNTQDNAGSYVAFASAGLPTGVTATLSAYSLTYGGSSFSTASIGTYGSAGLGVCASADAGANATNDTGCNSPEHQFDNAPVSSSVKGQTDFLLITFSTAVNLSSITLGTYGSGSNADLVNMSYWTNVTTTLSGGHTTLGANTTSIGGLETTIKCQTSGSGDVCPTNGNSVTFDGSNTGTSAFAGTNVTSLLISAEYASTITSLNTSYFKLQGLNVTNYTPSATPEPASFVLIGSGLLAGAFFGRRRIFAKSNS